MWVSPLYAMPISKVRDQGSTLEGRLLAEATRLKCMLDRL
jgi:hypothetical protein